MTDIIECFINRENIKLKGTTTIQNNYVKIFNPEIYNCITRTWEPYIKINENSVSYIIIPLNNVHVIKCVR